MWNASGGQGCTGDNERHLDKQHLCIAKQYCYMWSWCIIGRACLRHYQVIAYEREWHDGLKQTRITWRPQDGETRLLQAEKDSVRCCYPHDKIYYVIHPLRCFGPFSFSFQSWRHVYANLDWSRMIWIYILKEKSEVFNSFKNLKVMVENQTRKKIKGHRPDDDIELYSEEFNELYTEGIARHHTMRGTP